MNPFTDDVIALRPEDLFPTWCHVDCLERNGEISVEEARRFKHEIFRLMMLWDLEPDDIVDFTSP